MYGHLYIFHFYLSYVSIPVDARSKAWVCDRSRAGIASSNPVGGMDVCLLRVLYVVQVQFPALVGSPIQRSPTTLMCLSVNVKPH